MVRAGTPKFLQSGILQWLTWMSRSIPGSLIVAGKGTRGPFLAIGNPPLAVVGRSPESTAGFCYFTWAMKSRKAK